MASRAAGIAIYGATGHTGRFVVDELRRRGRTPIAIGRDAARLRALYPDLDTRTAQVDDGASIDRALAGTAAVINCAGPFLDTAGIVASAAVRARIHYLDVTAEQASAQATFERFENAARRAGVCLVPAMGFYGGFGDLLATAAMRDWTSADELRIGIALDSWQPTEGTRATGRRNTMRRYIVSQGRLMFQPEASGPSPRWDFPEPFGRQPMVEVPLTETVVIARHLQLGEVRNYLNEAPLRDLGDPATPPPQPADASGRSAQRFAVEAIVRKASHVRAVLARGRDIYAFTAPLVVEALERLVEGEAKPGAFAPGQLFDAVDFLKSLAPESLQLRLPSQ